MVNSEELARQYWVYQTEDEEKHKQTKKQKQLSTRATFLITLSKDEPNIVVTLETQINQ
jgi:hypothetical protein